MSNKTQKRLIYVGAVAGALGIVTGDILTAMTIEILVLAGVTAAQEQGDARDSDV